MNIRDIAEQIFLAGVESVKPSKLIPPILSVRNNCLIIEKQSFLLDKIDNIYVIGAGKASASMASEVEKILDKRIKGGHIVVKYDHSCKLKYIKITEAGHPDPDSNGFRATDEIIKLVTRAGINDLIICLLSGGGSALLPDFPEGSSPADMIKVSNLLVKSGAAISEINAVRKHLSKVKGGQLARAVYPATMVNLILSDVPGDRPDLIASGPTIPDPTTFSQALEVLDKYSLSGLVPATILKYLKEGEAGLRAETPKPEDALFSKITNCLIGTNRLALEAARLKALEYNINPVIVDDQLQGDTISVAEYLVETALRFRDDKDEVKPVCLLFGGETTVRLEGSGSGGRNQHLALTVADMLKDHRFITILSAGTDGTDGTTGAAGAVVDSSTIGDALNKNIDAAKYLSNFDSFHFFKKAGGHVITGPTMTNVMDIIVVIVE